MSDQARTMRGDVAAKAAMTRMFLAVLVAGVLAGDARAQTTSGVPDVFATPPTTTQPTGTTTSSSTSQPTGTSTSTATGSAGAAGGGIEVAPTTTKVTFSDEVNMLEPSGEVRVQARFADVVGVAATDGSNPMDKVLIRGTAKLSPADGGTVRAVISWDQALRTDSDRKAQFPTPLRSQFSTDTTKVDPGTAVNAAGDVTGAMAAVRQLFDEAATQDAASADTASAPGYNGALDGGGGAATSSGAGTPSSTSDFKLPATTAVAAEAAADVYGETSDGCPPRVDLNGGVVVLQSKTTKNGVAEGACSDTVERIPLQKSYTGCFDQVDLANLKAHPQYRRYYSDTGGTANYVDANCQPDTDAEFPIVTDTNGCSIDLDLTANKATKKSRRVYTDRDNRTVVVADCSVSAGDEQVAIAETDNGCSRRDDFAGGTSYKQTKWTYKFADGIARTAAECADNGTTFAHSKVSSATVCTPTYDLSTYQAFPNYRIKINVSGQDTYITNCEPDTAAAAALQATKSGCEGEYTHNIAAGQSWGKHRYYHTLTGGATYVTGCDTDTSNQFTHQTRITSYQHNDVNKTSQPLTEIYFADGGSDVLVSSAQVRAGAAVIPYTYNRTEVQIGGITYTAGTCDRYTERNNYDVHLRADSTEYSEFVSAATPLGPTNACVFTNTWTLFQQQWGQGGYSASNGEGWHGYFCGYRGVRTGQREDGTSITIAADNGGPASFGPAGSCTDAPVIDGYCSPGGLASNGIKYTYSGSTCPATPPTGTAASWNLNNGWN